MDEDVERVAAALILGAVLGASITYGLTREAWRADLINRDLAIYCPTSGIFAFNDECATE